MTPSLSLNLNLDGFVSRLLQPLGIHCAVQLCCYTNATATSTTYSRMSFIAWARMTLHWRRTLISRCHRISPGISHAILKSIDLL